jgi:tRNA-(ms[2]io[6]A)-hydroxylase
MSRLAREELRHFEQVLKLLKDRKMRFTNITAARYASGLREHVRKNEPGQIIDLLIIGAFIEARSCERFAALAPYLDKELEAFYVSLLKSEARHYQDYLKLAGRHAKSTLGERIAFFREIEKKLVLDPDKTFRFHSGPIL